MFRISPSIICGDLLNLEKMVKVFEKNNVDYIHFDIADTSFVPQIMLYPGLLVKLKEITDIPLDIHIMVKDPSVLLDSILAITDEKDFITIHAEAVTGNLASYLERIKQAGRNAGVALNLPTSVAGLEYVSNLIDMIILIQGTAGTGPRQYAQEAMKEKISDTKIFLEKTKNNHCLISVDGSIDFENSKIFKNAGADVFVLGTCTVFKEDSDFSKQVKYFRENLEE